MTITIGRPIIISAEPPELPPFLQRKRGPGRRVVILPDILRIENQTRIFDRKSNWITIVYHWMNRVTGESIFDPATKWETTHTSTRRYRQWLETYHTDDGIPPHISFGGAIEAGERDETFHCRWQDYARETFA